MNVKTLNSLLFVLLLLLTISGCVSVQNSDDYYYFVKQNFVAVSKAAFSFMEESNLSDEVKTEICNVAIKGFLLIHKIDSLYGSDKKEATDELLSICGQLDKLVSEKGK